MVLARIQSSPGGADLRTFECPKCDRTVRVVVEDPLKSDKAARWQNSELKPPK
jgi:hypothetical protein